MIVVVDILNYYSIRDGVEMAYLLDISNNRSDLYSGCIVIGDCCCLLGNL